jgi:hypothetical protein
LEEEHTVSQSAPGWYQDHDDPRLARWWDGERWTEHTLVLEEQDWSTEPAPPTGAGTRFPVDTGSVTAVEGTPAGYEEDIYAPIRDPWSDEPAAPADPTTAWSDPETAAWTGNAAIGGAAAAAASTGWDDDQWQGASARPNQQGFPGQVRNWPSWAKVGVPLAVLAIVLLAFALAGALGGGDDSDATTTTSTTAAPSLADASDAALRAAGTGPFTASQFSPLIQLACQAAEQNNPQQLTDRIVLLGYDAETVSKLIDGLDAGTALYCPDAMADAPTLLNTVETSVLTGTTTSTSTAITVPGDSTSTTRKSTSTTKKPTTSTTKKPVTTSSSAPTSTSTVAPTSSTAPTTSSTEAPTTTAP